VDGERRDKIQHTRDRHHSKHHNAQQNQRQDTMAPITHHLVSLAAGTSPESFVAALRALPEDQKPLWVGQCHHWVHDPRLSVAPLTGSGPVLKKWDFVIVAKTTGPASGDISPSISGFLSDKWSINAEGADNYLNELPGKHQRLASEGGPALPTGWTADNHDALDAAEPFTDLNLSLDTKSPTMGKDRNDSPVDFKTFNRTFGTSPAGAGPIAMFNLLSFFPGQMPQYFKYVEGFINVLGPITGAQPLTMGLDVSDWSSKDDDKNDAGSWEMVAVVWYPSIWHFGVMLGDERYAQLDRDFKVNVVRDNPLVCCTPVDLD
jgi:hypothetical protein